MKKTFARVFSILLALCLLASGQAFAIGNEAVLTVPAGETVVVEATTEYDRVIIEEGGSLTAPDGHSITMTVNGVEVGQILTTTEGTLTHFVAEEYVGNIVVTITETTATDYSGLNFPIRQAIYLDETGYVAEKSVPAAVYGDPASLKNIQINSLGENFNGIYAAGGDHYVDNATIYLVENGRSDMAGAGAALYADGEGTRLIVDNTTVYTKGVVRTAAIGNNGANLVVKNSTLVVNDGILPEDYVPSVDVAQMRGGFPIGGSIGNARATNLMGLNTKATYINTWISAEGWGVLSTDGCTTPLLTGINSVVTLTGDDIGGYGAYAIGDVLHRYYGCTFNVDYDVLSIKGGDIILGDSNPEIVAELNAELDLGLTEEEIAELASQNTVVNSKRFGFVVSGSGEINVEGNTQIHTNEAFVMNMGQSGLVVNVDGSEGAEIHVDNGIILQVMDSDSPGPSGNPYTEPTEDPVKEASFEPASLDSAAVSNFKNIELVGDFFNSVGYTKTTGMLNMAVNFDNATVTGLITSASADHLQNEMYVNEQDYKLFGVLIHTPCPAVNNGVIVSLTNGSVWNVTGDSYLTSLTTDTTAVINGTVTVGGEVVATPIGGTWEGDLVVTAK